MLSFGAVLRMRSVCLALAWAAALGGPGVARADVDRAERLFNAGVEDMLAGRFEAGCTRIGQSQREDPKPGTVFTLAECFARWGRTASAAAQYQAYLETVKALPANQQSAHSERVAVARSEYEKLLPDVPELVLVWPGPPPRDATVTLDGVEVDQDTLGRARHVDPGQHKVEVSYGDGSQSSRKVAIEHGQSLRVILPSAQDGGPSLPPVDDPPPEIIDDEEPKGSSQRTWAYIVGGVGVGGVLVGTVSGIFVLQQKSVIDENCDPLSSNVQECNAKGMSASRDAKTAGTVSTIAFGVGAVGLGIAIPLLLTAPSRSTDQTKRPGWHLGVRARRSGPEFSLTGTF